MACAAWLLNILQSVLAQIGYNVKHCASFILHLTPSKAVKVLDMIKLDQFHDLLRSEFHLAVFSPAKMIVVIGHTTFGMRQTATRAGWL